MKEITTHKVGKLNNALNLYVKDDNNYSIEVVGEYNCVLDRVKIKFQDGATNEPNAEINGISIEVLLAIVLDRLNFYQERHHGGMFKCRENAIAITKIQEAILWLQARQRDRIGRGVDGREIV